MLCRAPTNLSVLLSDHVKVYLDEACSKQDGAKYYGTMVGLGEGHSKRSSESDLSKCNHVHAGPR